MSVTIPAARYALVGGSGTWGARFPEDIQLRDVELVNVYQEGFATPYGQSAPFKLLRIAGEPVWRVAMHGMWLDNGAPLISPWLAAKQVAWVLEQAGVQWALVEGSVGGIQSPATPGEPLPPWSVVIPDDFMMLWRPHDDQPFLTSRKRVTRLRQPFCPTLRNALIAAARQEPQFASVHEQGVYVTSIWPRFETKSEIDAFGRQGGHVVGHTLGHEMLVWRRLGIRVGSLNIVSNHAEGDAWQGYGANAMADFYAACPHVVGPVMVEALRQVILARPEPPADEESYLSGLDRFPVRGA